MNAIMVGIDPSNLPLLNERLTQFRRRKEHLQGELRAAKAASRDHDEKGLRRWARERITGLADAAAGHRNENVRRVLASYVDEIIVDPVGKTGVMRVNAGLAALIEAGRDGLDDPCLRPLVANERPRGANGRPRNANDRPNGRSPASAIVGALRCSAETLSPPETRSLPRVSASFNSARRGSCPATWPGLAD